MPLSTSFCQSETKKTWFATRSKQQKMKSRDRKGSGSRVYGFTSLPSSNDITGQTPVGPCNPLPDPELALKDFTVQIHQQSYRNSIKLYVWLADNQKLQTPWVFQD